MRNKVLLIIPLLVLLIACNLLSNFVKDEQDEVVVENDTENNVAIDNTQVSNVNQPTAIELTEEERIRETEVAPTVGTPISPTSTPNGVWVDYAGAIYNTELRYTIADGEEFSSYERAQFLLALSRDVKILIADQGEIYINTVTDDTYQIVGLDRVAEELLDTGIYPASGITLPEGFEEAYIAAKDADEDSFDLDGILYRIVRASKSITVSTEENIALATLDIFSPYHEEDLQIVDSFEFKLSCEQAIKDNLGSFSLSGQIYKIEQHEGQVIILTSTDQPFAMISRMLINPLDPDEFLTVEFKILVIQSIENGIEEFSYTDADDTTTMYRIDQINENYNIHKYEPEN